MSAKRRPGPVGLGYMPKGGVVAAQRANDQWSDGRARDVARSDPAWPLGVVCWVVAASAGALVTEASVLWLVWS